MSKYKYKILNFWNDDKYLYVDYNVINEESKEKVHADYAFQKEELEDYLIERLEKREENEFNLPKISELQPITIKIFDKLCSSENNTLFIYKDEDIAFYGITPETYKILCGDIDRFKLNEYFELRGEELIVYGGLRYCFNDDRIERSEELER